MSAQSPMLYGVFSDYPVSPSPGTPAPSSLDTGGDGGILSSLGSSIQGLSNIGLQWFTAVNRGVSGPLTVPQPIQATPAAATANILNQLTGYLPLFLLLIVGIFVVRMFVRK